MRETIPHPRCEDPREDLGCAYLVNGPRGSAYCGAPRQASSSYCSDHHSLCYIACGSNAEAKRLREVETLASAVGGRRGRRDAGPSRQFLERLEQRVSGFSTAK